MGLNRIASHGAQGDRLGKSFFCSHAGRVAEVVQVIRQEVSVFRVARIRGQSLPLPLDSLAKPDARLLESICFQVDQSQVIQVCAQSAHEAGRVGALSYQSPADR